MLYPYIKKYYCVLVLCKHEGVAWVKITEGKWYNTENSNLKFIVI